MPAPKTLAVRPTASTAVSAPTKRRPEAPASARPPAAPSNAAVTAALVRGTGPATAPPLPGRPAPAAQDMVGNGAVAAAGRGETGAAPAAAAPAPPARGGEAEAPAAPGTGQKAKARPGPHADPKFAALKKDVRHKKRSLAASHPPPRAEAVAAQDAALPPKDDEVAQGKAANAERMNEAEPKEFDKDAFIRAVEKAIADKAPKNLDEADKFAGSGKADEVRAEVHGRVGDGKSDSAEQITTTTAAPPDTSAAVPKKVVPMSADRPPGAPGAPNPAQAVPDRLPPSATDMSAGPAEVDRRMADAQVTETQLRKSNEPGFTKALGEKRAAERHSDAAPGRLRKHEAAELRASTARAKRLGTAAMGAMGADRVRTGQRVDTGKKGAKSRDEEKRAQVTAVLQGVFDTMKKDVEAILEGLDKLVDDQFGRGEKAAREAFTAEHRRKMDEYKDRRYSGATGKLRWVRDLFAGLPAEADRIFEEARDTYVRRMRQVISGVADTIGTELNRAKRRIAQGRAELRDAVRRLPADLRTIGQQAAAEFTDKFDELTQAVDDKGTQLVDTLATKYTEALKAVDDEIAAEKEKNKGLVAKAVNAVKAVINTILELKRLLLAVLAKAAQAVMLILKDPIGFLRNLVSAVGAGLRRFLQNIGRHLQQGILSWLLGRTAEAGLELPAKFDTQGVVRMLAGLLGLSWQNIRGRITRKVPEPAVAAAETGVPLLSDVRRRGVTAMWEDLRPRVGDLRKKLLDDVIAYVTPTIVVAGITWVISLLNPASAFVRAVKLIIDFIRFVVTQARQIFDFVNAVLDAVIAIARGGSGGVPALIERALARSIPVLLGVLAAVLGVGGVAARVRRIVQRLSAPVNRAVDWVIDKIVGLVKKLWAKLKSKPGKKPPKRRPDRDRPGGPRRRRRPDRRGKPGRKRDQRKKRPDKRSEQQKKNALDAAVRDATRLLDEESATVNSVRRGLPAIKRRHRLTRIQLKKVAEDRYRVRVSINPEAETPVEDLGDKFPYKIGPAEGQFKIRKHGKVVDQLNPIKKIPMAGGDSRTGFVINMAAVPGEVKKNPGMAARYLHEAWKHPETKHFGEVSTAVVIGVNTFEHLDPKNDSRVLNEAIDSVKRPVKLLMAVFGFTWTPKWLHNDGHEVPIAEVRKKYRELTAEEKLIAERNEKGLRDKGALPYGLFREQVTNSSYTREAVAILSQANDQVHILGQDADTGAAVSETTGVLAAYRQILQAMDSHPLITIGGYHFKGFDWSPEGDQRPKQLTLLANTLDRAIRVAIGKRFPQMLYPTEPNMLIKAWDRRRPDGLLQNSRAHALRRIQGGLYGIGQAEGRNLRIQLMELFGEDFTVAYAPEASTTTSPEPGDEDRGLTVRPSGVHLADRGLMRTKGGGEAAVRVAHRMYALIIQSQSYTSAHTLSREYFHANPGMSKSLRFTLRDTVFVHVENVAMLMADNPRLTVESQRVQAELQQLATTVDRLVRNAERQRDPRRKQAVERARDLTQDIVEAMTAPELQTFWESVRTALDDAMRDAPQNEGEPQ
ncbi:phage tail protein [Streptomyces roseolilacinus]|uniref:phage tail protein n=1 Tax=Streptomyces roseolilacinus TaxID=66904 RepID=UPI00381A2877